jgi:hypothetical protein
MRVHYWLGYGACRIMALPYGPMASRRWQGVGADGWARGSSSSDGDETDECDKAKRRAKRDSNGTLEGPLAVAI